MEVYGWLYTIGCESTAISNVEWTLLITVNITVISNADKYYLM